MNTDQVYLNGSYLPLAEAKVPVMDRGFLFGDGVYEVIPVYHGRLFRLDQHLRRLDNSLAGIGMDNPLSREQWSEILNRLVAQHPTADQQVYLQVTRGVGPRRYHLPDPNTEPTVFSMTKVVTPEDRDRARAGMAEHGIKAITLPDIRWQRCDIKAITLLANVMARQEAERRGADEAILIRDGLAIEGSASNLFLVCDGHILTPPKGDYMLPGITRDLVLELAAEAGMRYTETAIRADQLASADELWMTSSTREVMPVTELDGKPVGNGRPGPVWVEMDRLYQNCADWLRERGADGTLE